MKLLGAILAGGQSRRFGSDKAAVLFEGQTLLDHVAKALRPQCAELVVVGRKWLGITGIADWPEAGLGPLGGLAGALHHAHAGGFDAVLTSGCDLMGLPDDLARRLGPGPAICDDLPVVALWPTALLPRLADWLGDPDNRSVYAFADHVCACRVATPASIRNINHASDLAQLAKQP